MAETSVQRLPKPQMRGLLNKRTPMLLATCLAVSAVTGIIYRTLVGNRRKAVYAEFHKNYDAEKAYQRMKARGIFKNV